MVKTALQEARERWLLERRSGIGASEAAAVLGLSPWKTPLALYAEKIGAVAAKDLAAESEAVEWGKRLEEPIAQAYAEKTGRKVVNLGEFAIQRHKDLAFLMCTLDRVTYSDKRPDAGPLELKTGEIGRAHV